MATSAAVRNSLYNTLYTVLAGSTLKWAFCIFRSLSCSLEGGVGFTLTVPSAVLVVVRCYVVVLVGSGDLFRGHWG